MPPAFLVGTACFEDLMLRLTRTSQAPDEIILLLEGQIVAQWDRLLEDECQELLRTGCRVLLDLSGVSYLDRRAAQLLRELENRSVRLINCPPLVDELVREDAS
jgi:anti-anti-sigma regulatory factor